LKKFYLSLTLTLVFLTILSVFIVPSVKAAVPSVDVTVNRDFTTDEINLVVQVTGLNPTMACYSLDGQANVTFSGEALGMPNDMHELVKSTNYIALSDLQGGFHTLIFYVSDPEGSNSSTVTFTTGYSEPPPTNSPNPSTDNPTFSSDTDPTQEPIKSNESFSTLAMFLSGVIAGAVIVSLTLLIIYRKQNLKRKEQPTQEA
jgi:hypothetical protein